MRLDQLVLESAASLSVCVTKVSISTSSRSSRLTNARRSLEPGLEVAADSTSSGFAPCRRTVPCRQRTVEDVDARGGWKHVELPLCSARQPRPLSIPLPTHGALGRAGPHDVRITRSSVTTIVDAYVERQLRDLCDQLEVEHERARARPAKRFGKSLS